MKKILFVSPTPETGFIKNDLNILQRHYQVKTIHYDYNNLITLFLLFPRIIKGIIWADIIYIWFASFHALFTILFSKFLGKNTILIVGGYEIVNEPQINYGLMKSIITSWIPKLSIKHSDVVICVSKYSENELLKYVARDDLLLIYNAIDTETFKPCVETRKKDIVLTVGNLYKSTFNLKGLGTYLDVAKYLPELQFILVGSIDPKFKSRISHKIPHNVILTGRLPTRHLLPLYQEAKVYCQLSYCESFGVALAEAMACECVPVVTERGALHEVVGDTGFYVPYCDVKTTIEAVKMALVSNEGKDARKRIVENFSLLDREKELITLIKEMG